MGCRTQKNMHPQETAVIPLLKLPVDVQLHIIELLNPTSLFSLVYAIYPEQILQSQLL